EMRSDGKKTETNSSGIKIEGITQEREQTLLDVRVVIMERGDEFEAQCEYGSELFKRETIRGLVKSWREAMRFLLDNPEERVGRYQVSEELRRAVDDAREDGEHEIAIAATFTGELLAETVEYWMEELEIKARITFAPYNQVHQELLDEHSVLSRNEHG